MNKLTVALAALVSSIALFAGPRAEAQIAMIPGLVNVGKGAVVVAFAGEAHKFE